MTIIYPTIPLSERIKVVEDLIGLLEADRLIDTSNGVTYKELKPMLPALKDVLNTLNLLMYGD